MPSSKLSPAWRKPRVLAAAREAKVAVATKLDQLSRDVGFVAGPMTQKVPFIVSELGANAPIILRTHAALAQKELARTADRTRVALAASKAQSASRTNLTDAQELGAAATKGAADTFAVNALPMVRELQAARVTTVRATAKALNAGGLRTARWDEFHRSAVRSLLART